MNAYPLFDPEAQDTFGGTEVGFYQLALKLSKIENLDVSFVVRKHDKKQRDNYEKISIYSYSKLFAMHRKRFLGHFLYRLSDVLTLPHLVRFILFLRSIDADVYVQGAAGKLTALVAFYCRLFGKKFIYKAAHMMDCDGSYIKKHLIEGFFYSYGIRRADKIVTLSIENSKALKKSLGLKSRILKNSLSIKIPADYTERKFVFWVGRCVKWKKPEIFIRLADCFPDLSFKMICPVSIDEKDYFEEIRLRARKFENLEFIDWLPFDETEDMFRRATIFVNTSIAEGFPQTFVQAMANGVPLLSLSVDPDDFIVKNRLGFCSGDIDNMKKDLKNLMKNTELYMLFSKNAYNYAIVHHNIDNLARDYFLLFEEVLNA